MIYPIKDRNTRISSPFGNRVHPITKTVSFHNGIDIATPESTLIIAPDNATVTGYYENAKGGKQMVLTHDNGYKTGYAHLSKRFLPQGARVKKGNPIALTGSTGAVTGSHLHFTVRNPEGQIIDPLSINYSSFEGLTSSIKGITKWLPIPLILLGGFLIYKSYKA